MAKLLCTLLLTMAVAVVAPAQSWAQANSSAAGAFEEKAELTGTRKQLATIVFAGLAGAILGLSTLSFYGRPQDHLSNIAIGFALGVIGGATYTTYKAATQPYSAYDLSQEYFKKELYGEQQLATGNFTLGGLAMGNFPLVEIQSKASWQWEF